MQVPLGATRLGATLSLFPAASAHYLTRKTNLGSLLDSNVRLQRHLGMSDAEAALALFSDFRTVFSDAERAEAMAAHLLGLQSSGALSAKQGEYWLQLLWTAPHAVRLPASPWRPPPEAAVRALVNRKSALKKKPAQFDKRWQDCGGAVYLFDSANPASRLSAAAEEIGALLQEAAGEPGPLQAQHLQQGAALVEHSNSLAMVGVPSLRAHWASLRHVGLTDSQIVAAVRSRPTILASNWEGEAK